MLIFTKMRNVKISKVTTTLSATFQLMLRQKNHLTQKELGMAVGFPDSCADVRIAQYESDVRTPKEDLMKLFASTLGVPVELFTVPVLSEPREYEAAEYWRYELGAELD